jgi:hypothetical protein
MKSIEAEKQRQNKGAKRRGRRKGNKSQTEKGGEGNKK